MLGFDVFPETHKYPRLKNNRLDKSPPFCNGRCRLMFCFCINSPRPSISSQLSEKNTLCITMQGTRRTWPSSFHKKIISENLTTKKITDSLQARVDGKKKNIRLMADGDAPAWSVEILYPGPCCGVLGRFYI